MAEVTRLRPWLLGTAPLWLYVGGLAVGGLLGGLAGWDMSPR